MDPWLWQMLELQFDFFSPFAYAIQVEESFAAQLIAWWLATS